MIRFQQANVRTLESGINVVVRLLTLGLFSKCFVLINRVGSITQNGINPNANFQLSVAYLGQLATSDESVPSWLDSARGLFYFSSKSKIGRKRAEIRFSVEDLFLII